MENKAPKYHRILLKISGEALAGDKKTGLDFAFNLGSKKAHTLSVRPAVLWEVANHWNRVQFNKNKAQLYLYFPE